MGCEKSVILFNEEAIKIVLQTVQLSQRTGGKESKFIEDFLRTSQLVFHAWIGLHAKHVRSHPDTFCNLFTDHISRTKIVDRQESRTISVFLIKMFYNLIISKLGVCHHRGVS